MPKLSIFRKFDTSPVHYSGELNEHAIYYWLQRESTPILVDFTEEYVDEIFAKGRNALILFTDDKEAAYYKVFAEAADKLQRNMFFVVSGTKGDGIQ